MNTAKHVLCCAAIASVLISTSGIAASQLSAQGANAQQGGMSLSALTGLLSRGAQSLSADNMNNAAGICSTAPNRNWHPLPTWKTLKIRF